MLPKRRGKAEHILQEKLQDLEFLESRVQHFKREEREHAEECARLKAELESRRQKEQVLCVGPLCVCSCHTHDNG